MWNKISRNESLPNPSNKTMAWYRLPLVARGEVSVYPLTAVSRRLSCKREKLTRQCRKLLWWFLGLLDWPRGWRKEHKHTNFYFLVPYSLNHLEPQYQTLTTHNANRHCRVRFYTFAETAVYKKGLHCALSFCSLTQGPRSTILSGEAQEEGVDEIWDWVGGMLGNIYSISLKWGRMLLIFFSTSSVMLLSGLKIH